MVTLYLRLRHKWLVSRLKHTERKTLEIQRKLYYNKKRYEELKRTLQEGYHPVFSDDSGNFKKLQENKKASLKVGVSHEK